MSSHTSKPVPDPLPFEVDQSCFQPLERERTVSAEGVMVTVPLVALPLNTSISDTSGKSLPDTVCIWELADQCWYTLTSGTWYTHTCSSTHTYHSHCNFSVQSAFHHTSSHPQHRSLTGFVGSHSKPNHSWWDRTQG